MSTTAASAPRGAEHTARLLVSCPDRPGIVAAVSAFLSGRRANIVAYDQHSVEGWFVMRAAFTDQKFQLARFAEGFEPIAEAFGMEWRVSDASVRQRVALLASREGHCLLDLLWRAQRGDLPMDIAVVLSNHEDLRGEVEALGVPYHCVPVTRETKPEAEARQLELVAAAGADLLVLARYMQILTGDFLAAVERPVINIHHSFLPAFAGADPYRRAYERGVKLIGATAHYVTEELDAGPIIEQDVQRVGHGYTVEDLVRVGRELERSVLARAVESHLADRVLLHAGRTIVF